jgi:hypothetical protein
MPLNICGTQGSSISGSGLGHAPGTMGGHLQRIKEHPAREFSPQIGSSERPSTADEKHSFEATGDSNIFNLFYQRAPDKKLLEAIKSPQDSFFLLCLEVDFISFVKDSKEPFLDLPPCNSFYRMLTHKLADYYQLTHQVDFVAGTVRIFRNPFCRLPLTIRTISKSSTAASTLPPPPPPPPLPTMRIGGDSDTRPGHSRASSETSYLAKEK